jgi:gluconokinase
MSFEGLRVVVLLMGVSGAGKTTVGKLLASQLGWEFADADDYHSAANVEKMRNGIPLTDADRAPWLESLRELMMRWIASGNSGVLACSALKKEYRGILVVEPETRVVYLKADRPLLRERLLGRRGHYMKESMLESQIATLEEPDDAVVVKAGQPPESVVREIRELLG